MITNSREKDLQAKQEGDHTYTAAGNKFAKAPSSSRQWSAFRNPRIVRVSRSFGGKDRHSKVCTIRGLRDRRIRLSVPTAIQLYDLQDKLAVSQPSKVIDWLLDATKHEIDKLPPLQIPQGNFGHQFHQQMSLNHELNIPQSNSLPPFFDANMSVARDGRTHSLLPTMEDNPTMSKPTYWVDLGGGALRSKNKEVIEPQRETPAEKIKWRWIGEQENQGGIGECSSSNTTQVSAQNFFPVANQPNSFPGLNSGMLYNSYYHWEPSNLSFPQLGNSGFQGQTEDPHNNNSNNAVFLQSSLALPSGSQLFLCPPTTASTLFPPYPPYFTSLESTHDPRHLNGFPLSTASSASQSSLLPSSLISTRTPKSFPLNVNVRHLLHSQGSDHESQPNEDDTGP